MVSRIALIAILTLAGAARADFNPVPVVSYYESDGVRFPNLAFRDDPGRITYVPPTQWTYTGNASRFALYPPNGIHADASISAGKTATLIPLSPDTTTYY